ncbi:MAG TPA: hypothetical protein VFJ74_11930 [Gemmatimonadaceae bacterium]|nr:hypothetical protein [Gemmatimonadaceae bacterium]
MSTPLLSIRIDVDAWHGRQALGADAATSLDALTLAAAISSVSNRLRAELTKAYPRARVAVVSQHGTLGARPTRVRLHPARRAGGAGDAERVHVAEHAEMLRATAIAAVATSKMASHAASALDAAAAAADVRGWGAAASATTEEEGGWLAAE